MKSRLITVYIVAFILTAGLPDGLYASDYKPDFLPGRILVKMDSGEYFFKSESKGMEAQDQNEVATKLLSTLNAHDLQEMTPIFRQGAVHRILEMKQSRSISERAMELANELQYTYSIVYKSGENPLELAREIEKLPGVRYAEPHYTHTIADEEHIPNDPYIGQSGHDYFSYMNFYRAWAVSKSSPDVVIAIIDTGVYYDHPDLNENLWRNPEPGRANDFFSEFDIVNDTIGWNFWDSGNIYAGESATQNADPVGRHSTHGTKVTGMAAAVTNNGTGMAGAGYKSSFMPVKVGGTKEYPRTIAFGYHGIIYAALNEADIINCSFIGGGNSKFGRDAIELATEMGSVIVAAIGNNANIIYFYPASYEDVISVGAVSNQNDDRIAGFSNYGPNVDVFAVGQHVLVPTFDYNTTNNSWNPGYEISSGTSLSTPIVSGLAALIRAKYPDWPPRRIALQILSAARSIDQANPEIYNSNPELRFDKLLGRGVIDAHASLTKLEQTIQITNYTFKNDQGSKLNVGESGILKVEGINYGDPVTGISLVMESLQSGIAFSSNTHTTGLIGSGETFTAEWAINIEDHYQLDTIPEFRITYPGNKQSKSDQLITEIFSYDRLLFDIHDLNQLNVSISSDGTIGYFNAFQKLGGIGLIPGSYGNVLSEGGLMISSNLNEERVVINQVREKDNIVRHFLPFKNIRIETQNNPMRNLGFAGFRSEKHPIARDLEIELITYSYLQHDLDKVLLAQYHITNSGINTYKELYAGLFNSWKFSDEGKHHTGYLKEDSLLYVRHERGAPYIALAHLGAISGALALENSSAITLDKANSREDSLSFGIDYQPDDVRWDGFTDSEKHLALTSGTERTAVSGAEVSTVTGTGPYTLHPNSTIITGFIYAWGEDLDELRNQVATARKKVTEPTIQIVNYTFKNDDGTKLMVGERGMLTIEAVNHGESTHGVILEVESLQSDITFSSRTYTTGLVERGQIFTAEWPIEIDEEYRMEKIPEFQISFQGNSLIAPEHVVSKLFSYDRLLIEIHDLNRLRVSVSSDGTIGFMDAFQQSGGIGFIPGVYGNVLSEGGLMISSDLNEERVVINQVREKNMIARHFHPYKNIRMEMLSNPVRMKGLAGFRSSKHPVARNLEIEFTSYSYQLQEIDKVLLVQYDITNDSEHIYKDLYVGLFNSWKFSNEGHHHTGYVKEDSILYVRHSQGAPYVAVAHMGPISGALALDNRSVITLNKARTREDSLSFGIDYLPDDMHLDGFTDSEKHLALTSGTERTAVSGAEVSTVAGTGPYTLHPYSTITTGFIYAWGDDLKALRNQVAAARSIRMDEMNPPGDYTRTGRVADKMTLYPNYPNPFNSTTNIRFDIMETGPVDLAVYNILGQRVATLVNGIRDSGPHFVSFNGQHLASGGYLMILKSAGEVHFDHMTLIK